MTKLSVLPIAAILCLGLAAPSSAFFAAGTGDEEGSLGVSGYFTLGGEKQDASYGGTDVTDEEFFDDFELAIRASKGDFAIVADLSLSNTEGGDFQGHNSAAVVLDNYWMEWAAADNVTLKAGEYALNFGRSIAVYDAGGHNIGVSWRLDPVSLGLTIGKVVEDDGAWSDPNPEKDQDIDQIILSAETKGLGPIDRLRAMVLLEMDQIGAMTGSPGYFEEDSYTATFMGLEFDAAAGQVALSGELGVKGGERFSGNVVAGRPVATDQKGSYLYMEAGLDDLMPDRFGLAVRLFNSSKDYTGPFTAYENFEAHYPGGSLAAPSYAAAKRGPIEILFDEVNPTEAFTQAIILAASYSLSDRLSVYANLVPLASINGDQPDVDFTDFLPTPAEGGDSWGTEIDLGVVYAISDSFKYLASYAKFSEGDIKTGDISQFYNSLTFRY